MKASTQEIQSAVMCLARELEGVAEHLTAGVNGGYNNADLEEALCLALDRISLIRAKYEAKSYELF